MRVSCLCGYKSGLQGRVQLFAWSGVRSYRKGQAHSLASDVGCLSASLFVVHHPVLRHWFVSPMFWPSVWVPVMCRPIQVIHKRHPFLERQDMGQTGPLKCLYMYMYMYMYLYLYLYLYALLSCCNMLRSDGAQSDLVPCFSLYLCPSKRCLPVFDFHSLYF